MSRYGVRRGLFRWGCGVTLIRMSEADTGLRRGRTFSQMLSCNLIPGGEGGTLLFLHTVVTPGQSTISEGHLWAKQKPLKPLVKKDG